MSEFLSVAIDAAREAGALLFENFGKVDAVERKKDKSLVTKFDKESERLIRDKILSKFPDHGIIGEESGEHLGSSEYTWVIDPLDGTHNYVRGIPMFGVSIGLVYKKEFAAGVVFLPIDGELYTAEHGGGAFKNGNRISVSPCRTLEECTLLYDSSMKTDAEEKIAFFGKIAPLVFNLRIFGTSVRNLTYLAEGKIDLAVEFDDKLWDFAACASIVLEAGGSMTDHDGQMITPECRRYVASNGSIHNLVMELLTSKG